MTRREVVTAAADLQPGDTLRRSRPTITEVAVYHEVDQWRVMAPPVRLAMTHDVAVRFGIRKDDPGVTLRMPACEQVAVFRDVSETRTRRTG